MPNKVLTIDDSKTLRMIVMRHLKPFGVEVIEAENGSVGIEKAKSEQPDLILLDYNMPVLDGYHTLVELKGDPALKGIPVMMLTTETVKELVLKLVKLGLKDYIAKPFTRECLLQKVNPILKLYSGDSPPPELKTARPNAASESGKVTVLAVDDKENVLRMLRDYLGDKFNVIAADTGKAALSSLESAKPDWLFLDLDLPDMSGFRVYDAFKAMQQQSGRNKRVFAMVLRTAQRDIAEARARGIREFLSKPFTKDDVMRAAEGTALHQPVSDVKEKGRVVGFFTAHGDVRVLSCPEAGEPGFQDFTRSLGDDLFKQIVEMADEGLGHLVVKLSPGVISNFAIAKTFMGVFSHAKANGLSVRLVAETARIQEWAKRYAETRDLCTFSSVEEALSSFGFAPGPETESQTAAARS